MNEQLAWLRDESAKTVMHVAAEQGSLIYTSFHYSTELLIRWIL